MAAFRPDRAIYPLIVALAGAACGGGSSPAGPSGPGPGPTPTPSGASVSGFVYYDEDGDGALDPEEQVRLPDVVVSLGSRTGRSADRGQFVVSGVTAGSYTARVEEGSLPPFFQSGEVSVSATTSGASEVAVPVTLTLGWNRPNYYLAFGDSITAGEGASNGYAYTAQLSDRITGYWGRADVAVDGLPGSRTDKTDRLGASLNRFRPAWTLILYGTNDWNDGRCRGDGFPCYTIDNLRFMVGLVKSTDSKPVLGTIPPVNPAFTDRQPEERNAWVKQMNALIRPLAAQEGAALADVEAEFLAQPALEALFSDHVHPNNDGHALVAQAFFKAVTGPRSATASSLPVLFSAPGSSSFD
jgi:lysophospholipase L1-like esterase